MGLRLISLFSIGFILLSPSGRNAILPSHMEPWRDISNEDGDATCDDKYRYALKKTLDVIWVQKCRLFDAREFHRQLHILDGVEIENLSESLADMHSYLNLLGNVVSRILINRHIESYDRIDPLNGTIINKLLRDWNEIKVFVDNYKPKEAKREYEGICKHVNDAIADLPTRYKPIYDLVRKIQNQTYLNYEGRVKLAARKAESAPYTEDSPLKKL